MTDYLAFTFRLTLLSAQFVSKPKVDHTVHPGVLQPLRLGRVRPLPIKVSNPLESLCRVAKDERTMKIKFVPVAPWLLNP